MSETRTRHNKIDIVKAIGIILMVFYHAGTPGKDFVYLFHMALFFICSGYCYSHKSENSPFLYIIRKIKTLYIPCFISGFIVACLQNVFLDIHIYSYDVYSKLDFSGWLKQIIKCVAFGGGHQMLGANWFFRTLFFSSVLYMFLNKLLGLTIKKERELTIVRAIICFILTGIGGYLGETLSFGKYFNFLTVMVLLDIGFICKEYQIFNYFNNNFKKIAGIFSGLAILIILSFYGEISINSNLIVNPIYFIVCSVSGFIMIYLIADYLEHTALKNRLTFVGQKSIWILFFHYVGFKLVTLCEILVLNEPIQNLSAYPVHHTENGLWAVYGLCGVFMPLLFVWIGSVIDRTIKKVKSID